MEEVLRSCEFARRSNEDVVQSHHIYHNEKQKWVGKRFVRVSSIYWLNRCICIVEHISLFSCWNFESSVTGYRLLTASTCSYVMNFTAVLHFSVVVILNELWTGACSVLSILEQLQFSIGMKIMRGYCTMCLVSFFSCIIVYLLWSLVFLFLRYWRFSAPLK